MARVPTKSPVHSQDAAGERTERAWELLDQVRQFAYSRVVRKANYTRHCSSCSQCGRHGRTPGTYKRCSEEARLSFLVTQTETTLERLRVRLAELDAEQLEPEPEPAPTLFG